ncbi:helix-turn-helix transcriptional regulator [Nocardia bovistercoris]|uniref:Helix-turn-helix transcriptional regulator n=1 Tax=Nocardia bovistercoris TaxID=2785916 RepID=A0A931N1Q3_9NOCA|nr:helix-turn-helix transcriptional regulator [Nocardia bovistercoris]MBH0774698.1 helix-turn-helix transcriptional regulator [Nocardia bovistercoris]
MSADTFQRAAEKITRLCGEPRDLVTLWNESTEVLARAVPHYWTPCFYTLDPASLLMTSHFHRGLDEFPSEWLVSEYYSDDVNQLADVARSQSGISTLHEMTGGNPSSSPRWHRNMTMGGDQELVTRLRTRSGEVWGALALYREPKAPMFSDGEKHFVRTVAPLLAEGARAALLLGQAREPDFADSPGLLVLDHNCAVESTTPGVAQWLSELPDGDWEIGRLPSAVLTLAGRTLRAAEHSHSGDVTVVRVLSRTGTWVVLHGACLNSTGDRRIAIIIEPADPGRLYPLLMSAYGLTEREKDVTRLVLQGASTSQIAADLVLSAYTVQQHLKSIFDKTGVRSRRDLIGKVFFAHYEPRFRDNEQRVRNDQPIRGEPWLR